MEALVPESGDSSFQVLSKNNRCAVVQTTTSREVHLPELTRVKFMTRPPALGEGDQSPEAVVGYLSHENDPPSQPPIAFRFDQDSGQEFLRLSQLAGHEFRIIAQSVHTVRGES